MTYNVKGYEFLDIPQYPMDYVRITAAFNSEDYYNYFGRVHRGMDLGGKDSTYGIEPILSIANGEVILIKTSTNAGKYVVVAHEDLIVGKTVITRYLHLDRFGNISVGDKVSKGQILGYEGDTGRTEGAHLHFEMWIAPKNYQYDFNDIDKYVVDPVFYLHVYKHQYLSTRSVEYNIVRVIN
jgi:murein DD-endopeptidase MepM/ murein hydrolase activator NlpD